LTELGNGTRVDHCKTALIKNFTEDTDYKIENKQN